MQKEQFYTAIEDVKSKLPPLRDELIHLTQEYPWFSSAHLLLAKSDHLTGHVAFDANLKRAAIYAGQREALFDLIHKEAFTDKVRAFEEEVERFEEERSEQVEVRDESEEFGVESEEFGVESGEVEVEREEIEEKTLDNDALETLDNPAADAASPLQETLEEPATAKADETLPELNKESIRVEERPVETDELHEVEAKSEPLEEVVAPSQNEDEPEIKHLDDFDDLQREILLEAISSSIEKEVQEEKPAVAKQEKYSGRKEEPAVKPSSFTALLKQRSAAIKWEGGSEEAPEIPAIPDEQAGAALSPDQLIDKFIAADPKITPRKSAEFSNENLAKKSLVEDEQFVTETIARIYAKQGATGKAIKAYKLLSLKYPEKSIYFAHQIKKLQDRRKSTK